MHQIAIETKSCRLKFADKQVVMGEEMVQAVAMEKIASNLR